MYTLKNKFIQQIIFTAFVVGISLIFYPGCGGGGPSSGGCTIDVGADATAANRAVIITWEQDPGTSYSIYWSIDPYVNTSDIKISGVTSPYALFDIGLENGTTYYFVVANSDNCLSNVTSATPSSTGPDITATAGDSKVTLSWDDLEGWSSYNIYWSMNPDVTMSSDKIPGATSPYVHDDLKNETTYYYAVTAENTNGESGLSNVTSATPEVATVIPSAPTNPQATAGDGQVSLSWSASQYATSYTAYRDTTGGVTTSDPEIYSGVNTLHIDTGLANETPYYYVITASNSIGESDKSTEVSATPVTSAFAVTLSSGGGTLVNMCPDTTRFTASVTGGDEPYSYSWVATITPGTIGAGFDDISTPDEEKPFEVDVCAWDSMTEGTIKVTVTDSNDQEKSDSINVTVF